MNRHRRGVSSASRQGSPLPPHPVSREGSPLPRDTVCGKGSPLPPDPVSQQENQPRQDSERDTA